MEEEWIASRRNCVSGLRLKPLAIIAEPVRIVVRRDGIEQHIVFQLKLMRIKHSISAGIAKSVVEFPCEKARGKFGMITAKRFYHRSGQEPDAVAEIGQSNNYWTHSIV